MDSDVPAEKAMPMPARRSRVLVATALLVAAPFAGAQTTLHLTTTQQANCTATTDAQGLQLVPGGTDLVATGVTLTGDGCGVAGGNYQANVTVPGSAEAGKAFNVVWSASSQATICTYGGTPGVTGWPVGSTACQGAACGSAHTTSVTVPGAGNYTFSVTCTNASGFAQGALTATGPALPPQPANFALTAPATGIVGTPFQVSWTVSGAASCTGSAALNGSSSDLPGWTDVTTATSPRTVTPGKAGTWTLGLSCSNGAGSTSSAAANVVVSTSGGDADNCPAGRQTVADVCFNNTLSDCAANTDVTVYDKIWGRNTAASTPAPFPGVDVTLTFKNLDKSKYLAAKIAGGALPADMLGRFTRNGTNSGVNMAMSISTTCGDFNPATAACLSTNALPGAFMVKYKNAGIPDSQAFGCPLTPGQTYFLNIKATNPTQTSPYCSGNSCVTSIVNNTH